MITGYMKIQACPIPTNVLKQVSKHQLHSAPFLFTVQPKLRDW